MKIPQGYLQQEVIDTLYRVAHRLKNKFRFSYHTPEDIVQQAVLIGIQGLENYKPDRPLENFLYIHVKNRLCTFKRDNFVRPESDKPCFSCPFKAYLKKKDFCKKYERATKTRVAGTKMDCELFRQWTERNIAKQNVKDMLDYGQVKAEGESNMFYERDEANHIYVKDIIRKLEEELPLEFLADFQRMRDGTELSKNRKAALLEQIRAIVGEG